MPLIIVFSEAQDILIRRSVEDLAKASVTFKIEKLVSNPSYEWHRVGFTRHLVLFGVFSDTNFLNYFGLGFLYSFYFFFLNMSKVTFWSQIYCIIVYEMLSWRYVHPLVNLNIFLYIFLYYVYFVRNKVPYHKTNLLFMIVYNLTFAMKKIESNK